MPTRNVVLTDHHEAFIHRLVGTGRYQNASEVMRDALRSLERREAAAAAALAGLRQLIEPGMAQARAGIFVDGTLAEVLGSIDAAPDRMPAEEG